MKDGGDPVGGMGSVEDACLPELLADQAARTPDAVAVVVGDQETTYRELDRRADRLGRRLRGLGVGPDAVVGLYLERSLDMIVGLLAILKAGGAYLPLDANLPPERLALIVGGGRPRAIVTQEALASRLPDPAIATVCVDRDREALATRGRERSGGPGRGPHLHGLAYVIYTSGSTGVPKGIMIDHRALRDRVMAKARRFGFAPGDRMLQFTALSFDAAAAEIYPTLLSGATLVVHPDPSWTSPHELLTECERLGVTAVMLPPVYLQLLVEALTASGRSVPWLRFFLTGGEAIPVERLAAWARLVPHRPRFFYAYGPTETTITATLHEAPMDPVEIERLPRVPIGRPMDQTGVHVLDEQLGPAAAGQVGELFVTGTGLARGYVGDPALTAERFLPSPFGDGRGGRMYRTGDLARETVTGDLEFVGRVDSQVKIRGFRIDLGDVEAALAEHPGLGHVVVTARDGRLVAYCVARPGASPAARDLREFLRPRRSEYMIPSVFVMMNGLPLTAGGKIDRNALPPPREQAPDPALAGGEPTSPIEVLLGRIWCDLLHRERVGIDENFFEAGGDSLLANRIVSRVRDALGVTVPLRTIFRTPTIAGMAAVVTRLAVSVEQAGDMGELMADVEQMSEEDAVTFLGTQGGRR